MRITLDAELCLGYGNCVVEAPDLFDLDPARNQAVVLDPTPEEPMRESAERAVRICPAAALRIEG